MTDDDSRSISQRFRIEADDLSAVDVKTAAKLLAQSEARIQDQLVRDFLLEDTEARSVTIGIATLVAELATGFETRRVVVVNPHEDELASFQTLKRYTFTDEQRAEFLAAMEDR